MPKYAEVFVRICNLTVRIPDSLLPILCLQLKSVNVSATLTILITILTPVPTTILSQSTSLHKSPLKLTHTVILQLSVYFLMTFQLGSQLLLDI